MNQSEYEALEDEYLSHAARVLYVLCLRRHMDYSTGLVGTQKRRISYQQFKEHLRVTPRRRSTIPAFDPSKKQLRGYVAELENVGLIERVGKATPHEHMVFRLPLASVCPEYEGHMKGTDEGHMKGTVKTPLNQGLPGGGQQHEGHMKGTNEGHTSVTSVNKDNPNHKRPRAKKSTSLPDDFCLTGEMAEWAQQNNITINLTTETEKFKDHHTAKGSVYKDWTAAWRTWIRKAQEWTGNNNGQGRHTYQPNAGSYQQQQFQQQQATGIKRQFTAEDFDLDRQF